MASPHRLEEPTRRSTVNEPSVATADTLLNDLGWLRGLARSLVRDDDRADDLVQETLVVALESPPRDSGALRSWLRQVARHLVYRSHRTDVRRERRERKVADVEGVGSGVPAALERAELHRTVVEAVLSLDEPYRSTVLLRYFEGLDSAEVGERLGVPATTVRVRLMRAHDRLRQKLDAVHGQDRRAWVVPLFELARGSTKAASTTSTGTVAGGVLASLGGWIMAQKAGATVVAVVLIVAGYWWSTSGPSVSPGTEDSRLATSDRESVSIPKDEGTRVDEPSPKMATGTSTPGPADDGRDALAVAGETLAARVVDTDGQPLAGVRVYLKGKYEWSLATTDEAGRVEWSVDRHLPMRIELFDSRFLPRSGPLSIPTLESARSGPELVVERGARVAGRTVDGHTGEPVAGVTVRLRGFVRGSSFTKSDAEGRFELVGIEPGGQVLVATRPGLLCIGQPTEVEVQLESGESVEGIELAMSAVIEVSGLVVRNTDGEPVQGARVSLEANGGRVLAKVTNRSGQFSFDACRLGEERVYAEWKRDGEEWVSSLIELESTDGVAEPVTLRLVRAAAIAGTVVDSSGEALPNQRLNLRGLNGTSYYMNSDAEGRFEFGGLPPGSYVVPGQVVECSPGEMVEGLVWTVPRVRLDLAVRGRVVDVAGAPIAGARVSGLGRGGTRTVTTGSDGRFEVRGRTAYGVTVRCEGYSQRRVELGTGADSLEVVLHPTVTVSGRVIDRRTREPIPEFEIGVRVAGEPYSRQLELAGIDRRLSPDGAFVLRGVPTPEALVIVKASGYCMAWERVQNATSVMPIEIALEPAPELRGVVVDGDGRPVAGAEIHVDRAPRRTATGSQALAVTDTEGRFTLDFLVEPTGTLWAIHPDLSPGTAQYSIESIDDGELRIVLDDLGIVGGRITEGDGAGVPAAEVTFLVNGRFLRATTDEKGSYEVEVPSGTVTVFVRRQGLGAARSGYSTITVKPAEPTRYDYEFVMGEARVSGRIHRASVAPVEGRVTLHREAATGSPSEIRSVDLAADGTFEFVDVARGRHRLSFEAAFASETERRARPLEVSARPVETVDWDVARGGSARVDVQGLDEEERGWAALYHGKIELSEPYDPEAARRHAWRMATQKRFTSNGALELDRTDPGDYTLVVTWGSEETLPWTPDALRSRVVFISSDSQGSRPITVRLE